MMAGAAGKAPRGEKPVSLQELRKQFLPAIFLPRYPIGESFQVARIRTPFDSWPGHVGRSVEIRIFRRPTFTVLLRSCVFKKVKQLEGGERSLLEKNMAKSYYWRGEETELDILSFVRTEINKGEGKR